MALQTVIITQTGAGTFTVPAGMSTLWRVLLVAGGGGGGSRQGGGGGAGGVVYAEDIDVSAISEVAYYVGAGGLGLSDRGEQGEDTTFGDLTAIGGGGGARREITAYSHDGGSGGGQARDSAGPGQALQPGQNAGASDFGHDGAAKTDTEAAGAGGGGAGEPGTENTASAAGDGGDGIYGVDVDGVFVTFASMFGTDHGELITGEVWFGGGGGGGAWDGFNRALGGKGGGGDGGGGSGSVGSPADENTGGGGGAAGDRDPEVGGAGGSGILIIQYQIAPDAVTDLTLTALGITSVSASWYAADGVDDYLVEVLDAGDAVVASEVVTEAAATFGGLTADTAYTLRVTARNEIGDSPPTDLAFTAAPADAPADAPTVTVADITGTSLTITWPFVAGAEQYAARLLTPAGAELDAVTVTERTATFAGLTPNRIYQLAVFGSNAHGDGPQGTAQAATDWRPPGDQVALRLETVPLPAEGEANIDPDRGLKGVVRDIQNTPLPDREVRVYRRIDGERVATVTTDENGEWVWSGANIELEYYVIAINPAADAQDYAPAAANRLVPVVVV